MTSLLPDLPSAILRIALEDLEKVSKDSLYIVNPHEWHQPQPGINPCHVCLAGAVMAKTLKVPPSETRAPLDYDLNLRAKLKFIDSVRIQDVYEGLLGLRTENIIQIEQKERFAIQKRVNGTLGIYNHTLKRGEIYPDDIAKIADILEEFNL